MTSDPAAGSDGLPPSPYGPAGFGPPGYGPPSYGPPLYGPVPYGHPPYVHPGMRASAADRERTLDVLKAAYGEGRLTKDEFDARSTGAMAARTYGELMTIVGDLPVGPVQIGRAHV